MNNSQQLDVDFVDPAVPGSADMARYPDDVRAAIGRIADYREQRC